MSSSCKAPFCVTRVNGSGLACGEHFAMLPPTLRSRISESVSLRQRVDARDVEAALRVWQFADV